ncbi:MAG: adenylate/guanylate cyclase domain-containing protein [Bacteroidota bacterium]
MKTNANLKQYLKRVFVSIIFWTFCLGLFAIFRYLGIDRMPNITVHTDMGSLIQQNLVGMFVIGTILGILYATLDYFFDRYVYQNLSLGLSLVSKTFLYFLVTVLLLRLFQIIAEVNGMELNFQGGWLWWLKDARFVSILLYIIFCSFFFFLLKIAAERFGKGVFIKMLVGRYRTPKEEERIFMFLDLKDSTTIAERLGHLAYSQFIQDCFHDLNKTVSKHEAEIYQYVGDEAVLTWPYAKGVSKNNCVHLFFEFQRQRKSREAQYLRKYGIFPEFKAGLHGGSIMVAEVGFVKRELAYHGDVINTSARIQGQCNTYNQHILLSEKILNDVDLEEFLASKSLGNVQLQGKRKTVSIHTITQHKNDVDTA